MADNTSRPTRRRHFLILAATAAATALVATILVSNLISRNDHRADAIVAGNYIGYRWVLTEVRDGTSRTAIPAAGGGHLDLRRDGALAADNGINALTGRYSTHGQALDVTEPGSTYVGYVGGDQIRDAVIAALNAVVYGNLAGTGDGAAHNTVRAVTATRLTLNAAGLELTFQKAGEAPNS